VKFALFYEIPVAKPWSPGKEHAAYRDTLEQAVFGEACGWHAFWTVEHHFLEEYSHCSNPEVLYGAIAARTSRMRLGYGVRLMPRPYNHPVRTAESVAVLDLLSDGRVDFGTGRSATRIELEGFGIDPRETRAMWKEALEHVVRCWTNEHTELDGTYWQMPRRRVQPKPLQQPHPPIWAATTSDDGHAEMGRHGLGLCSFAVGIPPEEVKKKIDIYRTAIGECTQPIGAYVHDEAATFTMALVAPTEEEAHRVARTSFEWYPKVGARQIAQVAEWMAEREQELGNYAYAADMKSVSDDGSLDLLSLEYLADAGACVLGTPDQAIEACRRYEEAGVDLLLCLVNPYEIPHESVMQTIELMGRHVIPEFDRD
jgi:alkanesulfonate monooxygenase SsuD/methylene tetrahydromethanopterin reductase-like flavin-dependent oxidoreductase (luciferase family)